MLWIRPLLLLLLLLLLLRFLLLLGLWLLQLMLLLLASLLPPQQLLTVLYGSGQRSVGILPVSVQYASRFGRGDVDPEL